MVAGALLAGVVSWGLLAGAPSSAELERTVRGAGWLGPVVFVAIYIGWTVLALPGVVPTLAGGALFGIVAGGALTIIGASVGATVAFVIGRRIGHTRVRRLLGRRAEGLERWLHSHGFLSLVYARLVPIVPFNLLNYAAGVAGMSLRSYVTATAIGILPGTLAYTALGSTASRPGSVPFLVSVGAILLLTVAVTVLSRLRPAGRGSDTHA